MIDNAHILDNYRISITSDSEAFYILSLLYRDGPKSLHDISKATALDEATLKPKILKLYKASLLNINKDNQFYHTKFAENILSRFEISDLALKSLLNNTTLHSWQKDFLATWLDARSQSDSSFGSQYIIFLRAFNALKDLGVFNNFQVPWDTLEPRVYFAITYGLDPYSRQMTVDEYCNKIFRFWKPKSFPEWGKTSHSKILITWKNTCERALNDIYFSDQVLAGGSAPEQTDSKSIITILVLVRLASTLLSSRPDPGLVADFWRNRELPEKALQYLDISYPRLDHSILELLHQWDLPVTSQAQKEPSNLISEMLRAILERRQDAGSQDEREPDTHTSTFSRLSAGMNRGQGENGEQVLQDLRRLHSALDEGKLDNLSRGKAYEIWAEASSLADALEARLYLDQN